MKKELSFVLNYALNKGFQIHPDAFKILDDITDVKQLEKIIKEIVKEKTRQNLFQINQNDLETYLGIKDDPNLLNEVKIISSKLINNVAKHKNGGCISSGMTSIVLLYDSLFSDNYANINGGGIFVSDNSIIQSIKACTLINNSVRFGNGGFILSKSFRKYISL